ncbi:hypothetical protein [Marinobacter sp. F3R11]|uniref:hypothetical protein n=1 Tax=Marinobacter sp. F3R11 TaxID=2267231 RepID=UPI000DEA7C75|nr:hypothetical protein [Marinobacter sp. F3R11]RBW51438.1 hypothetical protein DS878_02590 [Marinobacter sp. F3R11]
MKSFSTIAYLLLVLMMVFFYSMKSDNLASSEWELKEVDGKWRNPTGGAHGLILDDVDYPISIVNQDVRLFYLKISSGDMVKVKFTERSRIGALSYKGEIVFDERDFIRADDIARKVTLNFTIHITILYIIVIIFLIYKKL